MKRGPRWYLEPPTGMPLRVPPYSTCFTSSSCPCALALRTVSNCCSALQAHMCMYEGTGSGMESWQAAGEAAEEQAEAAGQQEEAAGHT